jgi:hypothetical protein
MDGIIHTMITGIPHIITDITVMAMVVGTITMDIIMGIITLNQERSIMAQEQAQAQARGR